MRGRSRPTTCTCRRWRRATPIENRARSSLRFERLLGFHIEQNDSAGLFHRAREGLAHGERVAAVDNGARLRPNDDRPRQRFLRNNDDRPREISDGTRAKTSADRPTLHASGFVAEQRRARSHHRQEFPGPCGTRQFQGVCQFARCPRRSDRERGCEDQEGRERSKHWPHELHWSNGLPG